MSQASWAGAVRLPFVLILALLLSACAGQEQNSPAEEQALYGVASAARDTRSGETLSLDQLVDRLAGDRVVLVGESHMSFGDHLTQLDIIRGLYRRDPNLAIGLEFFQQPYQQALDDYVAGRIDEKEMLRRTEYFQRWRFDYRLYRPILAYARKHGIPLVALNATQALVDRVGEVGYAGLNEAERGATPAEIVRPDDKYRERLRSIFEEHRAIMGEEQDFERFVDVQLLWEESMAERAVEYLRRYPDRRLVVLAGNGHIAWRSGIPERILRRISVPAATVVSQGIHGGYEVAPEVSDYVTLPRPARLPPLPLLGIALSTAVGALEVSGFGPDSGAADAGVRKGDRIVSVDGVRVDSYPALRLELLYKRAGDLVEVGLLRDGEEKRVEVVLR